MSAALSAWPIGPSITLASAATGSDASSAAAATINASCSQRPNAESVTPLPAAHTVRKRGVLRSPQAAAQARAGPSRASPTVRRKHGRNRMPAQGINAKSARTSSGSVPSSWRNPPGRRFFAPATWMSMDCARPPSQPKPSPAVSV
jgi:hypothetical protein